MKRIRMILMLAFTILTFVACMNEYAYDGDSPSERTNNGIEKLRKELTEAPYGWKFVYFPRTDSLLFSNMNTKLGKYDQHGYYGYGGYYYLIKFDTNGHVWMKGDEQKDAQAREGRFIVRQGSFTQMSFTTYNEIHKIIGTAFNGTSDFLYVGKDQDSSLIFRTMNYMEPAKEYIVMQPLKSEMEWTENIVLACENRKFFEQMNNPQIRIHRGDLDYFLSDYRMNGAKEYLDEIVSKRYWLFTWAKEPSPDPNGYPLSIVGLGSGYVGTEFGLTMRAGIRLDAQHVFYDFKRIDDRFVCELVKVYDPYTLKSRLLAKHMVHGVKYVETGYVAEIFDNK